MNIYTLNCGRFRHRDFRQSLEAMYMHFTIYFLAIAVKRMLDWNTKLRQSCAALAQEVDEEVKKLKNCSALLELPGITPIIPSEPKLRKLMQDKTQERVKKDDLRFKCKVPGCVNLLRDALAVDQNVWLGQMVKIASQTLAE